MLRKNKWFYLIFPCLLSLNLSLTHATSLISFEETPQEIKREVISHLSIQDIGSLVRANQSFYKAFFLDYDTYNLPSQSTLKYFPKDQSIKTISNLYADLSSETFIGDIHHIFQFYQDPIENWYEVSQKFVTSYFGFKTGNTPLNATNNDRVFINALAILKCTTQDIEQPDYNHALNWILDWIGGGMEEYTSILEEIRNFGGEHLVLDGRSIRFIPPEIGDLLDLKTLFLGENFLSSLPPEIVNLLNLETLFADENFLLTIPEGIGRLSMLRKLNIQKNNLIDLPSSITNLVNLNDLNIQDNYFSTPPGELDEMQIENLKI